MQLTMKATGEHVEVLSYLLAKNPYDLRLLRALDFWQRENNRQFHGLNFGQLVLIIALMWMILLLLMKYVT